MSTSPTFTKAALTALAAMFLTLLYEAAKFVWLPHISPWHSYAITIVYCSVGALFFGLIIARLQQQRSWAQKASEVNLELVVEHLPGMSCIVDRGRLIRWNSRFQETLGYSAEELSGMVATETLAEDYRAALPARMDRAFEEGHAETEAAWLTKSGQEIPCYITGVPVSIGGRACILSMGIDIGERQRAEAALRKSEEQFRRLLANLPDVTWTIDCNGGVRYISPNVGEVLGYTPQEVLGGDLAFRTSRIHPDDRPAALRGLSSLFTGNDSFDVEYRVLHKNGHWLWMRNRALRTYKVDGLLFADGVIADISQRKRAEMVDARLASIVRSSIDAVIGLSADGVMESWNPAAENMFGYSSTEAVGQSVAIVIPPDRLAELPVVLEKTRKGERIERFDSVAVRKDGTRFPISLANSPIVDKTGAVLGLSLVAHDISERKQAEDALRLSEYNLSIRNQILNVFLTLPDNRMYHEVLKIVLNVTGSRHGWFGYLGEDGALEIPAISANSWGNERPGNLRIPRNKWAGTWGKSLTERRARYSNAPEPVPAGHQEVRRCLSMPILFHDRAIALLTVANRRASYGEKDQELLERIATYMAPVLSARIERDAQEQARRRTEAELLRAKERAEDSSRAKSHFLGNMSKALLTPMNHILNLSELALETALSAEQREYLLMIKTKGDGLLTLVDNLLDFTRAESGHMQLESIPFSLRETVRHAVRQPFSEAELLGLQTSCVLEANVPDEVVGDPARLRQVLLNLLGNAVKFTYEGKIGVNVGCRSRTRDEVELLIAIADTGVGIPAEKHHRIFEAFSGSTNGNLLRAEGGAGLGLALSSRIVEKMGGKIWLQSAPGAGSTFNFTTRLRVPDK